MAFGVKRQLSHSCPVPDWDLSRSCLGTVRNRSLAFSCPKPDWDRSGTCPTPARFQAQKDPKWVRIWMMKQLKRLWTRCWFSLLTIHLVSDTILGLLLTKKPYMSDLRATDLDLVPLESFSLQKTFVGINLAHVKVCCFFKRYAERKRLCMLWKVFCWKRIGSLGWKLEWCAFATWNNF